MSGKRYKANPNGKREPFRFELEDAAGQVTEFICQGRAQMLDLMEFAQLGTLGIGDPRAAKAIADLFETTMGPLVYADFRSYCRTNDVDPEVTMQILQDMVEYTLNDRPLAGSSPSSDGRGNTGGTSSLGSAPVTSEAIAEWLATAQAAAPVRSGSPSLTDLLQSDPGARARLEGAMGVPPGTLDPQRGSGTP